VLERRGIPSERLPVPLRLWLENYSPTDDVTAAVDCDRLEAIIQAIRSCTEVLVDADGVFGKQSITVLDRFFEILLALRSTTELVKAVKYLVCWPMAAWLRDELPPMPPCLEGAFGSSKMHFPYGGGARKHMRNILASRTTEMRSAKVCWAFLQGAKRGCREVPLGFIAETMQKHKEALSQALPVIAEDHLEVLRRIAREIFRSEIRPWRSKKTGKVYSRYSVDPQARADLETLANPSTNASYESKRSEGGRQGAVRLHVASRLGVQEDLRHYDDAEKMAIARSNHNHRWIGTPGTKERRYAELNTEPDLPWVRYFDDRGLKDTHIGGILPRVTARLAFRWASEEDGPIRAKVAGILEPLKCRLITKGEALPYWASMPMQKSMWRRLQKFPAFRLTGRPLMEADLHDLLEREKALGLEFTDWVSGDYSAATDGLSAQVNSMVFEEALKGMGATEEMAKVGRRVLGNHWIEYPEDLEGAPEAFLQRNGQLMGSPLSFPILCAINLCAYAAAFQEYTKRKVPLDQLPVLVNGDDICFRANKDFYQVWKKWISRCGFTLSQGKNYIAPNFVTVNSEGWLYDPSRQCSSKSVADRRPVFRKVGFLNTGLLYQGKSVERELDSFADLKPRAELVIGTRAEVKMKPTADIWNACIQGSNDPRRTLLRIHELWRDEIRALTQDGELNLHAAPELGGIGIVVPEGHTTYFTTWHQKVAGCIREMWRTRHFQKDDHGTVAVLKAFDHLPDPAVPGQWIDLNRPHRLEGRKIVPMVAVRRSYQKERLPRVAFVAVRNKLEPLRENERSLETEPPDLLGYQAPTIPAKSADWVVKEIDPEVLRLVRAYRGPGFTSPTTWNKRLVQVGPALHTDSLLRTDTDFVHEYTLEPKFRMNEERGRYGFYTQPTIGVPGEQGCCAEWRA
jgi:hypothetical protein